MNPSTSNPSTFSFNTNNSNSSTPATNNRPLPQQQQRAGSGSAPSTPTATGSSSTAGPSQQQQPSAAYQAAQAQAQEQMETKRAGEVEKRDRTLGEFMLMLDDYEPLIPEEVTDYFLQKSGFETSDPRLKRLLSLAAQKFVSDIATDAFHYARIRTNATPATRGRPPTAGGATAPGVKDKNRTVLTMDDLSASLAERGVNLKKPEYYQ
ncbi:transcription initiation factor TFIID 23-30kDa subunit-domain-containing protein [Mrakia frigida]|uniref:transcription initiation factor TFIID subunit 10 n=1 Tax=Mrakia frigida TaxID=29902 RepID=UPI003FCC177C